MAVLGGEAVSYQRGTPVTSAGAGARGGCLGSYGGVLRGVDVSYERGDPVTPPGGTLTPNAQPPQGLGLAAVFVARNRFAVLDKSRQILVKNLSNEVLHPNQHFAILPSK